MPGGRSDGPIDLGKIAVEFSEPDRLTVGVPAPDFKVQALDGKPIALADFRGKVVLLDFWATWPRPTTSGIPTILLIGPDGTIVATKLRGKRIAPAVEAALADVTRPASASKPAF